MATAPAAPGNGVARLVAASSPWQRATAIVGALTSCAALALRASWGAPAVVAHGASVPVAASHGCPTPGALPLTASTQSRADAVAQAAFERIYGTQHWGADGGGSGAGSTLLASRYARLVIELVVHKYRLRSMVDAPCGAMVWMPTVLHALRARIPCFEYVGVDIVRPVIAANVAKFAAVPWMSFYVRDFTREPLPRSADLIFCRDALQHLSLPHVFDALERFALSLGSDPARFLLVGSYDPGGNRNITVGAYFHIDLRAAPFELAPLEQFAELAEEHGHPKILLLYSGAQLAAADVGAMRRRAKAAGMRA